MDEELERLKNIHDSWNCCNPNSNGCDEKDFEIIEAALKEKENIESRIDEIFSNHNIKSFVELNERLCDYNELKFDDDIKQMTLNHWVKALKIIKEKVMSLVSLDDGKICNGHYRVYDGELYMHNELTKEEYDLLKEVFL